MGDELAELVKRLGLRSPDGTWSGAWAFAGTHDAKPYLFVERVCEDLAEGGMTFRGTYPLWTKEDREVATHMVTGNAAVTQWLYEDCRAVLLIEMETYLRWFNTYLTEESQRLVTIAMMEQKTTLINRGAISRAVSLGIVSVEEEKECRRAYDEAVDNLERTAEARHDNTRERVRAPIYEYRHREEDHYLGPHWTGGTTRFTAKSWRQGRRAILGRCRGRRNRAPEDHEEEPMPFFNTFVEL